MRMHSYMTSETEAYGEAWPWVDGLEDDALCSQDLSLVTDRLPVRAFVTQPPPLSQSSCVRTRRPASAAAHALSVCIMCARAWADGRFRW